MTAVAASVVRISVATASRIIQLLVESVLGDCCLVTPNWLSIIAYRAPRPTDIRQTTSSFVAFALFDASAFRCMKRGESLDTHEGASLRERSHAVVRCLLFA